MKRKQIIKHYKSHFGLEDTPFNKLGHGDKTMIEWAEDLVKNCNIPDVSQQRELLEWLSNEDYFNIPKDEISEILEDWKTYNSNCC